MLPLVQLYHGDCREVMATMDAESIDAIVSDPPYGLEFMGKGWDRGVPGVEFWTEALRVAKPGAHLLAFGGTRTFHRLACAIEDAGWEIRDCVMWVYGSGFPKSHNIGKAIDRMAGAQRPRTGKFTARHGGNATNNAMNEFRSQDHDPETGKMWETAPATEAARRWEGWGTALKPAWEPIIVARKPFGGTVAANVLAHGTGAINVEGCRVPFTSPADHAESTAKNRHADFGTEPGGNNVYGDYSMVKPANYDPPGRWPANLIHDGSAEVLAGFPVSGSPRPERTGQRGGSSWHGRDGLGSPDKVGTWPADDGGSAARFFYCAKASKADRDAGLGDDTRNIHPTVKPTDLMRYLCRLVTPPGGVVLDPFMGSGSTGRGAVLEGFRFVGIDLAPEYVEIARARIFAAYRQHKGV
jgi:DNA modification methylase